MKIVDAFQKHEFQLGDDMKVSSRKILDPYISVLYSYTGAGLVI
jgi:hypothetical protein